MDRKPDERLFSKAAEAAVVGSMIIEPECIDAVSKIVGPDSFALPEHKIIYQTVLDMREAGNDIDGLTVRNHLEENRQLDKIGGVEYLSKILNNIPTSANAEYYANIVAEKAQRRQLVRAYESMGKVLDSDRPVGESITQIKSIAERLDGAISGCDNQLIARCMADIKAEPIHFLWHNRFARGKLNGLMGDPNIQKTFLSLYITSKVTKGGQWPDTNGSPDNSAPKGSVIIFSAEDGLADTISPRLDANGADPNKIKIIEGVRTRDDEGNFITSGFCLKYDLPALQKLVDEIGDVVLIVFDPVSPYLGDTDTHRDSDVRAILAPLSAFAEKNNIAVLLIRHLNKDSSKKAIYRDSGSLAFMAAMRTAWLVSNDPDNPESKRRLMTPVKSNILIDPTGLSFEVIDGKVVFENEPVNISADDCLKGSTVASVELDKAVQWLQDTLTAGKAYVWSELEEQAKAAGITKGTLQRAKKPAGVTSYQLLIEGKNQWFCRIGE